ncbi:MAG: hypothetical protein EOO53_20785, partial [Gammaproteobacteria bacterium]
MRLTLSYFCLCVLFAIPFLGNARPFAANGANYDIVYHQIKITVNPGSGSGAISNGSVTTYFKTTVANVSTLQFDIDASNLTVSSATYHGASIGKSQNSTTDVLTLTLPSAIAAVGTLDSVTVFYSGNPVSAPLSGVPSGYNFKQRTNGQYCIFTLGEAFTGHNWWPCKESLYDKIDSVDLIVTAPSAYKVAGNGTVTEVVSGSNIITTWKTRIPIATYGVNFAVADYVNYQYNITTGGKTYPVLNYFYSEHNNATYKSYADNLKNIIPAFSSLLQVNYPFASEKYGLAECTAGWGALEVQSMTFMASDAYGDNGYTIAHEAAHQWFGDMVTTNSWHQVWLNEGFAQYFQSVIYPELLRPSELDAQRSALKGRVKSTSTVYVPDTTTANNIFIPTSTISQPYDKGAMLISMLRTWVGDAGFYNGLRDYLTMNGVKYAFGHVDSLEKAMQAYTPVDLTNFFSDWVNKKGYANFAVTWYNVGKKIYIKLAQTPTVAASGKFDVPVPIRITGAGLDTTVVIIDKGGILYNSATGATNGKDVITYNLSAIPTGISFDAKSTILGSASTILVNSVLPLRSISLEAKKKNNSAEIKWTIDSDEPSAQVTLEKSTDGQHFSPIKKEDQPGNQTGEYTDAMKAGIQYYRLKVTNLAGDIVYSKVQAVSTKSFGSYQVLPNPASNDISLLLTPENQNGTISVTIRNASGQLMKT